MLVSDVTRFLCCLSLVVLCSLSLAAQPPLEPGKPQAREITGGQNHPFLVNLTAGQFARIEVEQRGIDIVINVMSPGSPERKYISFADEYMTKQGVPAPCRSRSG